jgi:DNA sulfur modification protein DndD
MYLKNITLRDWKAYGGESRIEFPTPTKRKNVVIIGAPNGFGKTSILEALLFGLYGRDALPLVARANKNFEREIEKGYPSFLQRALHAHALNDGRQSMTVELGFEDIDSEAGSLSISRTWYFRGDGAFREEQVQIFMGAERRPLRAPRLEDDADDYFRGRIAQEMLPAHLAQFFLFDGEQVQRLAQADMAQQVRLGIEGMLGATALRMLVSDLQNYARDRRNRLRDVSNDDTLERIRAALEAHEAERDKLEAELAALSDALPLAVKQRDELSGRLQSLQGGNVANVKELQRNKDIIELELARLKDQLSHLLTNELSLAIAGRPMRERVKRRLDEEKELAAWEGGIQNSARQLTRFSEEFDKARIAFDPPLTDSQISTLKARIAAAWQEMWHPPPDACATFYRHSYLADADRISVGERLQDIDNLGQSGIQDLLYNISESEADRSRHDQQLLSFQAIGPALDTLVEQLQTAITEISEKTVRKNQIERELIGVRAQVQGKKADYQRLSAKYESAQPDLARITLAERIAGMLPAFVEDTTSTWVDRIAEHMTEAYREIAHKQVIQRVEIDRDCQVRLLTRGGQDYRSLDASAGEDQVFSFALISAIASATEVPFPIVIDTPLARLDKEHRLNILRHFTQRAGEQIILLSQNTEVVGEYLDAIKSRVARTFLIEHKQIGGGFGQNHIVPDKYFEPL